MKAIEAKYVDGLAMGRALLSRLRGSGEDPLLMLGVERFCSEHSERATLPSWVGCKASFPQDWIDCLGRWSASCSAGYIRTAKLRIRKMQLAVADLYRTAEDPSTAFGEEELFEQLATFMRHLGTPEEDISEQVSRLRIDPLEVRPPLPTEPAEESNENVDDAGSEDPLPITDTSSKLVVADANIAEIPLGTFVVSLQARTRFRRLHRVGDCWRKPGVDYLDFEILGMELPKAAMYNAACSHCFNKGEVLQEEVSSGSSSSEGPGSS